MREAPDWPGVSERAATLHRDAVICDMTLPWRDYGDPKRRAETLPRMAAGGVDFISLSLSADWNDVGAATRKLARERAFIRANADRYALVETADDILAAKSEGKVAVSFHFQGTNPVANDVAMVEVYYRLGVRHMLMAYNIRNAVADGCNERTDAGLSRFGVSLVGEMNRVGMLVDGTHTGYRATMDLFEVSTDPVIFSHANPAAVKAHRRNIRDDQIRACARSGGVIGIAGVGIFLGENDTSLDTVLRHIDHVADLVGPRHIGLGLDYVYDQPALTKGHDSRPAWNPDESAFGATLRDEVRYVEPENLPSLTEALLARGYGESDVRGILGENWLRVARRVWK